MEPKILTGYPTEYVGSAQNPKGKRKQLLRLQILLADGGLTEGMSAVNSF
jgi:hypothetical protein